MKNYEIGPIRPPSEANSLLVRVTRGCHWNKCFFCGLYKNIPFSIRPIEEIIRDIKTAAENDTLQSRKSCFLQDGDALNIPTVLLLRIVRAIKEHFPSIQSITTYARADSIRRKKLSELIELKEAGLNHFYRGIETGSDEILKRINKGITSEDIIVTGLMCKEAGIILSEFTLLGIGGKRLSEENAIETAKVINAVNPEYIRVHHTAFKPNTKMGMDLEKGLFDMQNEDEVVREQRLFIETLNGITSYYVNEHAVNLILEVRGRLPDNKEKMLSLIDQYLGISESDRLNFAFGRRIGAYYYLHDMSDKNRYKSVEERILSIEAEHPDVDFSALCNALRSKMI